MDLIGPYSTGRFPPERLGISDALANRTSKPYIGAFLEVDVTEARKALRDFRRREGRALSFLAWFSWCLGRTVADHPHIHTLRLGRRKTVTFEDVDITLQVEKDFEGERIPVPYVLRKVQEKSPSQIGEEIDAALEAEVGTEMRSLDSEKRGLLVRLYPCFPRFLRSIFWRRYYRNPFLTKKISGLVGITSLAMFGRDPAWVLPSPTIPISIALGTISRKPWVVDEAVVPRDILALTVMIDHDLVDGAPAARFLNDLAGRLKRGEGIPR